MRVPTGFSTPNEVKIIVVRAYCGEASTLKNLQESILEHEKDGWDFWPPVQIAIDTNVPSAIIFSATLTKK